MNYSFKTAPWDKGAKVITICVSLLLLLPLSSVGKNHLILNIILLITCGAPFLCAYLFAPLGYTIMDEKIAINRIVGDIIINKSEIKSIKVVEKFADISVRAFASGGLFGYFGSFILKNGERATVYCCRFDQVVVIRTDRKIFIISPLDAQKFYEIINLVKQ